MVDLIQARGYEATTIEQVAEATKTSKATLYRHWADKPTLVVTALKETSAVDLTAIDTGRFASDMEMLMDMLAERAQQNINLVLTLAEASRHDRTLGEVFHQAVLAELATLQAISDHAIERGEIPHPQRTPYLRDLILGALFGSVLFGGGTEHIDAAYLRSYLHTVILPYVTGRS